MFTFTRNQIRRFSNIFDNAGQVILGSLVLGPLFGPSYRGGLDSMMVGGSVLTFFLWWLSLRLERISS